MTCISTQAIQRRLNFLCPSCHSKATVLWNHCRDNPRQMLATAQPTCPCETHQCLNLISQPSIFAQQHYKARLSRAPQEPPETNATNAKPLTESWRIDLSHTWLMSHFTNGIFNKIAIYVANREQKTHNSTFFQHAHGERKGLICWRWCTSFINMIYRINLDPIN